MLGGATDGTSMPIVERELEKQLARFCPSLLVDAKKTWLLLSNFAFFLGADRMKNGTIDRRRVIETGELGGRNFEDVITNLVLFAVVQGVWIWSRPLDGFTPDGDPIKVLVLDTEGLGATDEEQNHDVRIFSLAILLASYFVYNS